MEDLNVDFGPWIHLLFNGIPSVWEGDIKDKEQIIFWAVVLTESKI